jgi:AbrB family looped-hinge helix DNA binding protein
MSTPIKSVTISRNGQFTIPKKVWKHLGVEPGDKVALDIRFNGKDPYLAVMKVTKAQEDNLLKAGILPK